MHSAVSACLQIAIICIKAVTMVGLACLIPMFTLQWTQVIRLWLLHLSSPCSCSHCTMCFFSCGCCAHRRRCYISCCISWMHDNVTT